MVTGRLRQRTWETPEGEKRSVTEIEADEVGASLKWATAKVERSSQRGNGERNSGPERQAERGGDFRDRLPSDSTTSVPPVQAAGGTDILAI
jgi:single-strand DNA-binding protein